MCHACKSLLYELSKVTFLGKNFILQLCIPIILSLSRQYFNKYNTVYYSNYQTTYTVHINIPTEPHGSLHCLLNQRFQTRIEITNCYGKVFRKE